MTSVGDVFDPSDLDYGHISNVILRNVQSSLVPKIQSGRGDAMLMPRFISKIFRDSCPWLTYSLEVRGNYPGKVPKSIVAIIYPKGARVRELLLRTTQAVRDVLERAAPKIYGTSFEGDPKSYTAVVIEDVEGNSKSLQVLWPDLDDDQKKAVLDKVADIICTPIHISPPSAMQSRLARASNATTSSTVASSSTARPDDFKKYQLPPTNLEHLRKAYTILYSGLFHPNGEPNLLAFRNRFREFTTYELSPQDILRVKNLNTLLPEHMTQFTGGNFLPPHITGRNKDSFKGQKERDKFAERKLVLQTILSESLFRLSHRKMDMNLFFVSFEADGTTIKSVVLTQWDKAFFGPLWGSCRLPPWLELLDPESQSHPPPISLAEMTKWREYLVYNSMMKKERLSRSWLWFVAYIYGELERHFEIILTATWVSNAKTEPWLRRLLAEAAKKETSAYKKGADPGTFTPFSGKIETMEVNFAEMMGKWMPYARAFVVEEGLLSLPKG
ncbi:hypothetical protein AN958_04826 [Leucoagaricus sp. SymC.cos]|nr:hypothetical protein AN958_04826 [Leucoagaricus sp. SymC.cos]